MPDYLHDIEAVDAAHPFRMVAPPARSFLNTTFTETPGSRKREGEPRALLHADDLAARSGCSPATRQDREWARGRFNCPAGPFAGVQPGVVIVEGIWPNSDFAGNLGVNHLIGADRVPPNGGSPFHDTAVWIRRL